MKKMYRVSAIERTEVAYYVSSELPPEEFESLEDFYWQSTFEYDHTFESEVNELCKVEEVKWTIKKFLKKLKKSSWLI